MIIIEEVVYKEGESEKCDWDKANQNIEHNSANSLNYGHKKAHQDCLQITGNSIVRWFAWY